ncbi:kp4 domain-containing protein [Purpureocillium lilacinum]|uniref:Kp4 domain-containing protein n=1 Tax=Purpureocillium lilacinum TaxID=33203 RepID=A0A179H0U0_PURLI|nr:kp4 domain-containing protein [Purpureocillium lilacinum]OAQ83866.1 kp4 domain-containing protein [Purpureocillium lilacinum]OAQ90644.1 kp4 domain-containing protein [Purpureocillium lilacinum]
MQFTSILFFASSVAGLGINCRGSGVCSFNDASLTTVREQVGVLIADGGGDRRFAEGQQISCSHGSQGSVCAFYQSGASGSARDAYNQLQGLLDHGTPSLVFSAIAVYVKSNTVEEINF